MRFSRVGVGFEAVAPGKVGFAADLLAAPDGKGINSLQIRTGCSSEEGISSQLRGRPRGKGCDTRFRYLPMEGSLVWAFGA